MDTLLYLTKSIPFSLSSTWQWSAGPLPLRSRKSRQRSSWVASQLIESGPLGIGCWYQRSRTGYGGVSVARTGVERYLGTYAIVVFVDLFLRERGGLGVLSDLHVD